MPDMDHTLIELTVSEGIATLTLNRPDKRNAMSDGMRSEFIHALESVTADKAIREATKKAMTGALIAVLVGIGLIAVAAAIFAALAQWVVTPFLAQDEIRNQRQIAVDAGANVEHGLEAGLLVDELLGG